MARLPSLAEANMSAEQVAVLDLIGRERAGGPFAIWLHTPEIAKGASALSEVIRKNSTFERRLFELLTLAAVRPFNASYPFEAHAKSAIAHGIDPEIVDAIRMRRTPLFTKDDERLIYDTVTELVAARMLSQASYDRALAALGLEKLIELVTAAGLYGLVAMMAVAFDVDGPAGTPTLA